MPSEDSQGSSQKVTFCFRSLAAADMLSKAAEGPLRGPSCSLWAPSESACCRDFPCTAVTISTTDIDGGGR